MFSGFESLYGSSMPQFVTANRRREVPVSPPLINLGSFGPVGGPKTLEEQGAAAKLAHPNLRGGMLTMANKHQSDKEIAAAKNEAYWLQQAALQGPQFQPGQAHWTDPLGRFIFGSEEPGSGILAPIDYAGGAGSLLKWGAKAGAAALGGLMLRDFIKNPPEPGTLFSLWGSGTKGRKLLGGKFNLRFVGDGTKGQGVSAFGWGIYFAESKAGKTPGVSRGYAGEMDYDYRGFFGRRKNREAIERELHLALYPVAKRAAKERDAYFDAPDNIYMKPTENIHGDKLPEGAKLFAVGDSAWVDHLVEMGQISKKTGKELSEIYDRRMALSALEARGPEQFLIDQAKNKKLRDEGKSAWSSTGGMVYSDETIAWVKKLAKGRRKTKTSGTHVKVDIPGKVIGEDRANKLLDWFVPMSDHPIEVQEKVARALLDNDAMFHPQLHQRYTKSQMNFDEIMKNIQNMEGGEVYKILGDLGGERFNYEAASKMLNAVGLPGLRYQAGTLNTRVANVTYGGVPTIKTYAKPDNIDMNIVIWDQKVLDGMDYLGEWGG